MIDYARQWTEAQDGPVYCSWVVWRLERWTGEAVTCATPLLDLLPPTLDDIMAGLFSPEV